MGEPIGVTGVVLSAMPVGDYDKRLVILTKERGKITAFARGARRPNSALLAACNAFVFGTFLVYESRNAYSMVQANVLHHFIELASQQPAVYYGFYFLEFADYYGSENSDETQVVNLLYVALRALQNENLTLDLVRYIYELRIMIINGEYAIDEQSIQDASTLYTLQYIASSPLQKLFTFTVSEQVLYNLKKITRNHIKKYIDKRFKSLEVLECML